jgi:hypothetical protein
MEIEDAKRRAMTQLAVLIQLADASQCTGDSRSDVESDAWEGIGNLCRDTRAAVDTMFGNAQELLHLCPKVVQ